MSDKEDNDFDVFVTISEYRKYKDLQKQLDEANAMAKKEKLLYEEKAKLFEKAIADSKKELNCSFNDVQRITMECLTMKKEKMELD